MSDSDFDLLEKTDVSLLDTLDHVLNRGLVISGEITISVADIDLIYLGLNVVLGSVETIKEVLGRGDAVDTVADEAAEAAEASALDKKSPSVD
jgi:hypothetical protein